MIWDMLMEQLHNVMVFLKGCDLSEPLGVSITLWQVLVSLFIIGTVLNLITGISDDEDDD